MTTTVLAYFPSPPQGVWHLGPLPIRAYALFIITGIVVALLIGDRRFAARGGERGVIYDIALWAVPFGLIGGRLYHLATDWPTYFGRGGAGLGAALRIWDGGLGIWGAVALGGVGAWIGCRRRGIPLPAFGDAIAPGIVLAQAIGRLGNYFNQELYGRETTLPWGLEIFYRRDPAGFVDVHSLDGVSTGQLALVVQPTFLYELLWNVLVFVVLIYLDRRFTLGHGRLFALYVAGYCVGRFCVELLRDDTATHIAGIRINSFTSTFVFIGAIVYVMLAPKGREDPATVRGYVDEEADAAEPEPAAELVTVGSAAAAGGAAADTAAAGPESGAAADTTEQAETAEPETEAVTTQAETVDGDVATPAPDAAEADAPDAPLPESEAEGAVAQVEAVGETPSEAEVVEPEPVAEMEAPVAEPEGEGAVAQVEAVDETPSEAEAEVVEPEPVAEPEAEVAAAQAEAVGETQAEAEDEAAAPEPEPVAEPEAEGAAAQAEAVDEAPSESEPEAEPEVVEPEAPEVTAPAAEDDVPEGEAAEPEAEGAAAQAEAVDAAPSEPDAQETEADDAGTEAPATEADAAPSPAAQPTLDDAGSTRPGWRNRLRTIRRRSGR